MGNKIRASMQDKASEFMETNKKRWHDLNFRHLWITGLYGSIFLVFILVFYIIFAKANIFQSTEVACFYCALAWSILLCCSISIYDDYLRYFGPCKSYKKIAEAYHHR